MSRGARLGMLWVVVMLSSGPGAAADEAVPDLVLDALKDRVVALRRASGEEVVGTLLAHSAQGVVVAKVATGEVLVVPRAEVLGARLLTAAQATPPLVPARPDAPENVGESAQPPPPELVPRRFGLQLGFAPSVLADVEADHFYAFLNVSILFPFITQTSFNGFGSLTSQILAGMVGAGATFHPFDARSCWALDAFATFGVDTWYTVGASDGVNVAMGLGVGAHCTLASGLTLAFKLPVVGGTVLGGTAGTSGVAASASLGHFYLNAVAAMPVFSVGYRFR